MNSRLLFGSKKATVTAAGMGLIPAIVYLLATLLSNYTRLPADVIEAICLFLTASLSAAVGTYNIGQGMADWGKEAQKEQNGRPLT